MSPLSRSPVFFLPEPPLRQVFFPNRLLAGFPWLCADLYADTPLTRFFVRLRFLIFLIAFLSLRHGNLLVESANTSPGVSFVFRLRL